MALPDNVLPSWTNGFAKLAILDFVARITTEGGADFVPPAQRIATFDNDGTLWCEQPMQVQGFFLADRVRQLAAVDPSLKDRQPFKAFIEHDHKTLHALGKKGLQELFFATHTGMTEDEFDRIAQVWFASARHPELGRLFTACVYRPQVELLRYLRDNGFKTFIVSGGGVDFIRAFANLAYGIQREQVIGSSNTTRLQIDKNGVDLVKLAALNSFDDRDAKVQNIGLHIGRRPILAFGNSDGDLAMLRYVMAGAGSRLALLLHHDDASREFQYDRDFRLSPLSEALERAGDYGITVVSMAQDWNTVFSGNEPARQTQSVA